MIAKLIHPLLKLIFPKIEKKIDDLREDLVEHFAKVFKLDKVLRYMELPNDADRKIEKLEEQAIKGGDWTIVYTVGAFFAGSLMTIGMAYALGGAM